MVEAILDRMVGSTVLPEEGDAADSTSEYEKEKAKEVQKKDDEIAEGFPPHSYFGRFLLLGKRRS